jgi:hypothetical protein
MRLCEAQRTRRVEGRKPGIILSGAPNNKGHLQVAFFVLCVLAPGLGSRGERARFDKFAGSEFRMRLRKAQRTRRVEGRMPGIILSGAPIKNTINTVSCVSLDGEILL